jgi:enoyl-[acyl-carrier protein] reductase I
VLVCGVANERSIAWAIAEAMHRHGARLILTYAGKVLEKRVRPLAESVRLPNWWCHATSPMTIPSNAASRRCGEHWDSFDVLDPRHRVRQP